MLGRLQREVRERKRFRHRTGHLATYEPDADFFGIDSFTYMANDGELDSNVATATITVNPLPDVPVAQDDEYFILEDQTLVTSVSGQNLLFIDGDPADGGIRSNGVVDNDETTDRVGARGDFPVNGNAVVYFFELPVLGTGDVIVDANLSFHHLNLRDSPEFNADLYGLGWVSEPAVLQPSWYWDQAAADTRTGDDLGTNIGTDRVVKIQDQILFSTSSGAGSNVPTGEVSTDAAGDATLSTFLASLYDHGARAGDFAVLRINPDSDPTVSNELRGYLLALTEDTSNEPRLTIVSQTRNRSVLANDTDVDGDPSTATLVDDVTDGTLTFNADGSFTYVPDEHFVGVDSFTYVVDGSPTDSNLATVEITVDPADWTNAVAASDPLNWYRLDELVDSTVIDYGSEGLDGTYGTGENAPTRGTAGLVGTGVTFDGDKDTIVLGGSDLVGNWTAEFVVQKNFSSGRSSILIRGDGLPAMALKLEQHGAPEQVGYTQFAVRDYVFDPPVLTQSGEFMHLVFVKDSSAVRVFLNGEFAGSRSDPVSLSRDRLGDATLESPFAIAAYRRSTRRARAIGQAEVSVPEW